MGYNQHTPLIVRFNEQCIPEPNTGCWIWMGRLSNLGYGRIRPYVYAHRASYVLFKGDIPDGMHVLHSCDNRWCVNPDHLRLGTHLDNMADKKQRGRCNSGKRFSEDSWNAKITENQAAQIKALHMLFNVKQKDIAKQYGVSCATVSMIITGKTWRHIKNQ